MIGFRMGSGIGCVTLTQINLMLFFLIYDSYKFLYINHNESIQNTLAVSQIY